MIERVLIVDDEPLARARIAGLVRAIAPQVQLSEAGDGAAAITEIEHGAPHAVLLDIQMPGVDGFGVVERVTPARMPPTVFVTAFDGHALQAFEVAAVDYLLKPFDDTRFEGAWRRLEKAHATATLAHEAEALTALLAAVRGVHGADLTARPRAAEPARYPERVIVRNGDRSYPVAVRDIRWMRSDGNYVDLFTSNGTHTLRETLSALESRLDPARFVRIHRRIIVAIDNIRELQPWFGGDQILILRDGTKLRVSRTRRDDVAHRLAGTG